MSSEKEYIRVFVRDCAAQLRVGTDMHEKHAPQTVIVNLECESAVPHCFNDVASESFEHAVDYTKAYTFIMNELSTMPHIPLLESVAEVIASFCLRDLRIASVRVRLEKPKVLPNTAGAGVEIYRARKAR